MKLLHRLKGETHASHQRLERSAPLLREDLSLDAYRAHLERLLGFYGPVEAALAASGWERTHVELGLRWKAGILERDLLHLGHDRASLRAIPRCRELPRLPALPEALACSYVLGGATLGGEIQGRHVRRALGLTPAEGCAFLTCYGDAQRAIWSGFCAHLEAAAHAEGVRDRVISAARETFAHIERWLAAPEP